MGCCRPGSAGGGRDHLLRYFALGEGQYGETGGRKYTAEEVE